jgi:hypothetical protein
VSLRAPLRVTIVAANRETRGGLQTYLAQAGAVARATQRLATADEAGRDPAPSAIVFFPDEFRREDVIAEIARLQRAHPQVLAVVVTREPREFEGIVTAPDAETPVVIPKPAWGWTILDSIRARLEAR